MSKHRQDQTTVVCLFLFFGVCVFIEFVVVTFAAFVVAVVVVGLVLFC